MGDSVEIEEVRRRRLLHCFGRILLHLYLLDSNRYRLAVFGRNSIVIVKGDVSVFGKGFCTQPLKSALGDFFSISAVNRTVILRNLVSVRLILVKIMLAVKTALSLHMAIESDSSTQRWYQRLFLEHWLRSRKSNVKKGRMLIGCIVGRSRGTGEELPGGVELCMYLDADGEFPLL